MTNSAHGFYPDCFSATGRPRVWPGDEPDQQTGPDPAGEEEKEPEYLLLAERGLPRRREFVMQVGQPGCGRPPV